MEKLQYNIKEINKRKPDIEIRSYVAFFLYGIHLMASELEAFRLLRILKLNITLEGIG